MPRSYTMKMVEDKRGGCLGGGLKLIGIILLIVIVIALFA